jgi:CheY-like chemotaxis protein
MKPLALVVENDAGTRKLLDVLLTRIGIEVDLTGNGSDALLLLENTDYDMLFMDLMLPGASGFEILTWIASARPDALSRTVVLSSASEAQLAVVRTTFPSVRALRKPFELSDVFAAAQAETANRAGRTWTAIEQFRRRSILAGAKAGVLARLDGERVEVVSWYGYPPGLVESWPQMNVHDPFPLCTTIRHQRPVWLASLTTVRNEYPILASVWERSRSRALATVPLQRDGRVIGAAGWSFREPRLFSDSEKETLLAVAAAATPAIAGEPDASSSQSTTQAGA